MLSILACNFVSDQLVDWVAEHLLRPCLQLPLHVALLLPLVDQHVGILDLLLGFIPSILASEGLLAQILNIELAHHSVVELVPLHGVSVLDVGVVVAAIGIPDVHDHSLQNVVVIIIGLHLLLISSLFTLLLPQELPRVLLKIEFLGELAVIVDLQLHHLGVVELEALESDDQIVRQLLETHSLHCRHLLAASLAEVGVITIKSIALDHRVEGLVYVLLVFDCQTYR